MFKKSAYTSDRSCLGHISLKCVRKVLIVNIDELERGCVSLSFQTSVVEQKTTVFSEKVHKRFSKHENNDNSKPAIND